MTISQLETATIITSPDFPHTLHGTKVPALVHIPILAFLLSETDFKGNS